ncbi:MAG TPA: proteasome activator [Acidimicrobiales bacterium]
MAATHADTAGAGRLVAPAKAIRVLEALRRSLDELARVDLDDEARRRLVGAHRAALIEAASTVSDALIVEMVALHIEPLAPAATVDQLRVAEAQLLGWLNGLVLGEEGVKEPVEIGRVLLVGDVLDGADDEG